MCDWSNSCFQSSTSIYCLYDKLKCAGCGSRFLVALADSIRNTVYKFEDLLIHALQGVKQGGPTRCPLFTFFIDETIGVINEFGPDGFLDDLHTLLLMDDTAVLATSRAMTNTPGETCCFGLAFKVEKPKTKYTSARGR
jgi:hypothetical protein